jgi:ketosteroid isomerase-like protein
MTQALDTFLTAFWSAFEVAESSGDFSSVAPMCADNLVFQSPSEDPYQTLDSLVAAWWTPPEGYRISFNHAELVASDHLAVQRGIASDSFESKAGEKAGHRYNYLAVFGDREDGWKLTHFISNMIE